MSAHLIRLCVNGQLEELSVMSRRLLCDVLRDDLHLTGTKRGCETGVCGACSVIVNERLVKSCLMLGVQADGANIETIEGLARGDELHPLQASFMSCGGLQCGYCTPGMIMTAQALLTANPNPTEAQVREGLGANLCRCTGYNGIVDSVLQAAKVINGDR